MSANLTQAYKALDLVKRYSHLVREIKRLKDRIHEQMQACKGIDEQRDALGFYKLDSKGRGLNMHLWNWYEPFVGDNPEYDQLEYNDVTLEEHGAECPHCYAAHLAIQERKQARKALGIVKRSMTVMGKP